MKVKEVNKDYITVSWEPPETDGGTPVIQYIVEKKDATRTTGMWVLAGTVEADVTQYKVGNIGTDAGTQGEGDVLDYDVSEVFDFRRKFGFYDRPTRSI